MMGVPAPAYTADIPGFLAGGSASGSAAMAQMVQSAMTACPNTKMVISGYRSVSSAAASLRNRIADCELKPRRTTGS
jgi:LAS superfamily LD-carboxypeptidase LdcB